MSKLTLILLCIFVGMLPFEAMLWFNEADVPSVSKFVGILLVVSAIVAFLAGHPFRFPTLPVIMRILIFALCAISYTWSIDSELTLGYVQRLFQLLVFFLLIWEFAVTYDDQLWVFRSFLAGMVVPTVMALRAFRSASAGVLESGERFTGGGHDLNYLAYMYSVAILLAIYMSRNQRPLDRGLRWVYWGFAGWCVVQALLTGSRGGLLSLLATAIFAAFMLGLKLRSVVQKMAFKTMLKSLMWFFLLIGTAAPVAWFVVPQELLNRLTLKGGSGTSIEDDPRLRIWRRGMEGFWKSPIVGVGTAGFFIVAADDDGTRRAPHNTFISVLVELGVIGLALYLFFLVLLFRAAWRLPDRERLLWIGILSITVLNAMTCGSQGDKFTWFLYAMVLAQAAALGRLASRRRAGPLSRGVVPPFSGPLRPGLPRS
jgi:O-antigen ligase